MKTHAPASEQTQQKSQQQTQQAPLHSEAESVFEDHRPESAALQRFQSMAADSPHNTQLKSMQAMMAASSRVQQLKSTQNMMANSTSTTAQYRAVAKAEDSVQKMENEEPLQGEFESEPTQLEAAAEAPRPNNTGLPDNLKSGIENLSGMSMDHVKVHYNSDKPAQLQAHAYAQGSEIHVAPGQEQHLPHEAWHVVQQAQGRVKPTVQMKGDVQVNDDVGLETEADLMGGRALGLGATQMHTSGGGVPALPYGTLQNRVQPTLRPVSAAIQRRTIANKSVKTWISWALRGGAEPNLQAIMLVIYNQMKRDTNLGDADYATLVAARTGLIDANQIDQEDVDNLEAEATRRQQSAGNPAELIRLRAVAKIAEKYNAVDAKYGAHIFQGGFNKTTPTGFHSKADGSATHQAYGAVTPLANFGAYQQSVSDNANPVNKKPIQSTFFPDAATHQQVISAIASVYEAGFSTVTHVHANVNGMALAKRGDTVFPAGGSDARLAL